MSAALLNQLGSAVSRNHHFRSNVARHRTGLKSPRLVAAKARLDRLDWWPTPVRIERVRLLTAPWFFRLPWLGRFDGYAFHQVILLRSDDVSDDLVTHELCHVWQMQHRPIRMPLSYLATGYANNQYERQARAAAAVTRSALLQEPACVDPEPPGT